MAILTNPKEEDHSAEQSHNELQKRLVQTNDAIKAGLKDIKLLRESEAHKKAEAVQASQKLNDTEKSLDSLQTQRDLLQKDIEIAELKAEIAQLKVTHTAAMQKCEARLDQIKSIHDLTEEYLAPPYNMDKTTASAIIFSENKRLEAEIAHLRAHGCEKDWKDDVKIQEFIEEKAKESAQKVHERMYPLWRIGLYIRSRFLRNDSQKARRKTRTSSN